MSTMKQLVFRTLTVYFLLTSILFFYACTSHQHPDKKIFRYNETSGIASLDPAFAKNQSIMWAIHQVYNTLVEVNEKMQMEPSIALRWQFAADNKSIGGGAGR